MLCRIKGMRYPADPPTVEEIVAVMRQAGTGQSASRIRALNVVLRRAGLRISEALLLTETDLDPSAGSILVRPLFCVINGPSAGRRWCSSAVRADLHRLAARAGVRRQLGHANLGVTSVYLQGVDNSEIIAMVCGRSIPVMPASAGLRLVAS